MTGYFDDNKKEYIITNMFPRRKLLNYLWNDTCVCRLDQFGCGNSWSVKDGVRRGIDDGERLVYIKDRESKEYFSANRNFSNEPFDKFLCRVGLGYHIVESEYKGIRSEFSILLPAEGEVLQMKIKIKNISNKKRCIDLYFYNSPEVITGGHESYISADKDDKLNGIYYDFEGFNVNIDEKKTFLSSEKPFDGYDTSNENFKGIYRTFANPVGLERDNLSCKGFTFSTIFAGAFRYALDLKADEEFETVIACGAAKDYENCLKLAKLYANYSSFCENFEMQKKINKECLDVFEVNTPDEYFNSMANIWLKHQLSLGKSWGRLYGKGFRDVMQDIAAFVSLDKEAARKKIVDVLKRVYEDGNPIRMFEPDFNVPYNDCGSWIPATVLEYLCESGDVSVLDEKIPYLKGTSYENSEYSDEFNFVFRPYSGTKETYSVFDHIKRAVDYLWNCRGKRGLVLFRMGDWNDSLNNAGRKEKGESVWLTIATVKACNEFIEILKIAGKTDLIKEYEGRRDVLRENVLKYGIDGNHIIYGYNDYDEKIGSDENEEAKIFLNPQTWAVLANIADKKTLEKFMDEVENRLSCKFGYVQCAPSWSKGDYNIGRISYFKPGLVENGAVYNHGVAFKMVADCMLERGDNAYSTFKKISYDNPDNPDNGTEPYAVSNMYIGPENPYLAGYAPASWITGTAGWLYRCLTEYICGVRPEFDGLRVNPCLPHDWNNIKIKRIFRDNEYEIEVIRSDKNQVIINGNVLDSNLLPLDDSKKYNKVTIYIK